MEDARAPDPARLDGVGLLLAGVALAGLMFGAETVGRGVVPAPLAVGLLLLGAASGALYLRHARRRPDPLLDLSLLRIPTFAVSVWAGSMFRVGIGAIPFLLPLMLQLGFGLSAAQSGLITLASAVGAIVMKPAAQRSLRTFGFRTVLVWNAGLSAVLLAACAAFRPVWPMAGLYAVLVAGGFLRSLQFTAYNTIAYADIPRPRMSAATSLYSTIQQLSLTLGITVGAAALQGSTMLSGRVQPGLPDYSAAFLAVAAVAVLAAPMALRLPRDAGDEVSGSPRRLTPAASAPEPPHHGSIVWMRKRGMR